MATKSFDCHKKNFRIGQGEITTATSRAATAVDSDASKSRKWAKLRKPLASGTGAITPLILENNQMQRVSIDLS